MDPGRVFLTTGGLQGFVFYAAAQLERRPGRVLVEGPTYDRPLKILRRHGVEVVALPMDEEGLDPRRARGGARLAAEMSRSSTRSRPSRTRAAGRSARPGGAGSQSSAERTTSTSWRTTLTGSSATRARRPPSLHALDDGERVTFTSSFSKTVAPGLRVGWFVVPGGIARGVRRPGGLDVHLTAAAAAGDRARAACARRVRAQPRADRGILRAQRDAMLEALERELAGRATWSHPEGGYFLWLDLGETVDASALLDARPRRASRSCAARTSSRKGEARAPRGSRSATSRRSGSRRACGSSPGCSTDLRPAVAAAPPTRHEGRRGRRRAPC